MMHTPNRVAGNLPIMKQYAFVKCPKCVQNMNSAIQLTQEEILHLQQKDNTFRLEAQKPKMHMPDIVAQDNFSPCYQYSVVAGDRETVEAFLQCKQFGHLQGHCGVILNNPVGFLNR